MKFTLAIFTVLLLAQLENLAAIEPAQLTNSSAMIQPAADDWPSVFVFRNTCNVYLLRDGDSAILFNLEEIK